jgi:hypothetical protein
MARKRSRLHVQASKEEPVKRFTRRWYNNQPQSAKKWFENISLGLFFILIVFIVTLALDVEDSSYYKAHGALFMLCLCVALLLIIRRLELIQMLKNFWRVISLDESVNLVEINDALFVVALMIVSFSILFIIDLSFLSNYGIRIGAVAAIALSSLLRSLISSFRR